MFFWGECWKRKMLEEKNVGREKCWKRKMLEKKNVGKEKCWKKKMRKMGCLGDFVANNAK